jgi:hypothetical protein
MACQTAAVVGQALYVKNIPRELRIEVKTARGDNSCLLTRFPRKIYGLSWYIQRGEQLFDAPGSMNHHAKRRY